MRYRCCFKSVFSGKEFIRVLTDPDFQALRARFSPQFLYAEPIASVAKNAGRKSRGKGRGR